MKINYRISQEVIIEIQKCLNLLLENISIVILSRLDAEMANPQKRIIGTGNRRHHDIVKVINRWGVKDIKGKYYELLNETIGKISSCCPLLQIYESIELLVFNKMINKWSGGKKTFSEEEVEMFFLQPYEMITSSNIDQSSVNLYERIKKSREIYIKLKSEDAKEFLDYGVVRRLFMLKSSIDGITNVYNEQRIEPLEEDEKTNMSLYINTLYANIYAIMDCLAFVFAFECPTYKINRNNVSELQRVGLFKKRYIESIEGLGQRLNLEKIQSWYNNILELRHPIAHRIPLYFPEIYNDEEACKYKEAEEKYYSNIGDLFKNMTEPTIEQIENLDELHESWQKEITNLNVFSGCFFHSFAESRKLYHLSRITLDLGILCYLLDQSFEYLSIQCK